MNKCRRTDKEANLWHLVKDKDMPGFYAFCCYKHHEFWCVACRMSDPWPSTFKYEGVHFCKKCLLYFGSHETKVHYCEYEKYYNKPLVNEGMSIKVCPDKG